MNYYIQMNYTMLHTNVIQYEYITIQIQYITLYNED